MRTFLCLAVWVSIAGCQQVPPKPLHQMPPQDDRSRSVETQWDDERSADIAIREARGLPLQPARYYVWNGNSIDGPEVDLGDVRFRLPTKFTSVSYREREGGGKIADAISGAATSSITWTRGLKFEPRLEGRPDLITSPFAQDSSYAAKFLSGFGSDVEYARWVASLSIQDIQGEYSDYRGMALQAIVQFRGLNSERYAEYTYGNGVILFYGLVTEPRQRRAVLASVYRVGGEHQGTLVATDFNSNLTNEELMDIMRIAAASITVVPG